MLQIHLKITGVLLIALSLVHIIFPRYFNWAKETASLNLINRQMMYVHTFFIGFMVFFMGLLCLTSAEELVGTTLGKRIALGLGIFWTVRLLVQWFGYSSKLWKGKRFETMVHAVFSVLWIYVSSVFILTYLGYTR